MECNICMESLVAPVTWSCGHVVCVLCDRQLRDNKCSFCKAALPKKRNINLVMANLLRKDIDNYDSLAEKRVEAAKAYDIFKLYKKSTRYSKIKDALDSCLDDNCKLQDIYNQITEFTHEFKVPVLKEEINMVLSRHKKEVAVITMEGETWILPGYEEARSFLMKNKGKLTEAQKYQIIYRQSPYFRKLSDAAGLTHEPEEITFNITELLDFVTCLNLSNTEADSGSESDTDEDVYSSDDSDDDEGTTNVNNLVLSLVREN